MRATWVAVLLAAAALLLPSPAAADPVAAAPVAVDAGAPGSVSCGAANRGALAAASALPDSGDGYVTPEPWRGRGFRFATDELVGLIERAAARVASDHGGALLAVADLSAQQGGPVARHASHQSGRDADLIYYAIDRSGDPFSPDHHMPLYGPDGRADRAESPVPAASIDERFFDLQRNWALVVALVSDPEVTVNRIFVSRRVRSWLLAYARVAGVPPDTLAAVQRVLSTARDSSTHQDHLHVRIACSDEDVAHGRCSDATAPPPRRRRRGRRGKRVAQATKWYTQVRCADPRAVAAGDQPDAPDAATARSSRPSSASSARTGASRSRARGKQSPRSRAPVKARPAAGR
ncbi:MAG TPA: penicillin-insensitive murein endopeptidase [Kofleriaceae bacterium]|nr:penicillin-insensitive murein endopeptidase [Kofleriaceae bacterium]